MEPKDIQSLEEEVRKLEATGQDMQQSGEPFTMALGTSIIEATNKARECLNLAMEQGTLARDLLNGLKGVANIEPSLMTVVDSLGKFEAALTAVELAFTAGTDEQRKQFVAILEGQSKEIAGAVKLLGEKQEAALKANQVEASKAIGEMKASVKNLLQELEDGVKVSIENQEKLPVVGFTQGKVKGVDQAVAVMLVDETGRPTKGGAGGAASMGSFVGPEVLNDPLIEYRPSDADETNPTKYYGFLTKDGRWYIIAEDTVANTYRYFKGSSGYETPSTGGWAQRAAHAYDYFHNVF